jgi:hypothetical protein
LRARQTDIQGHPFGASNPQASLKENP